MWKICFFFARLRKDDILYDLGCGDGRVLITAAKKYGVRCVGVDIDPDCIIKSRENIQKAGLQNLVSIYQQDVLKIDLTSASVVTIYLTPYGNSELKSLLWEQLKIGARVVSHDYWIEDWKPWRVEVVKDSFEVKHLIYLWNIKTEHKEIIEKEKLNEL
ncbi:methyltransferase domain-containing protein [Candidatus Poribacteria bacterium]|nr:methyltransferase domain-containing protein [Candidatus Poribacteria bacterium]